MLNALFLTIPFISGFIFSSGYFFTRIKSARIKGHRLYVYSMTWGILLVLISAVILHFILPNDSMSSYYPFTNIFWKTLLGRFVVLTKGNIQDYHTGNIVLFILICFSLSKLLVIILNPIVTHAINKTINGIDDNTNKFTRLYYKVIENKYLALLENEHFEKLFYNAIKHDKLIKLTLKNNKVYIGNLLGAIDYEGYRNEIKLLPWLSGYRDKNTMDLIITSYYTKVYDDLDQGQRENIANKFPIIIDYSEVISASLFDLEIFLEFMKHKNHINKNS